MFYKHKQEVQRLQDPVELSQGNSFYTFMGVFWNAAISNFHTLYFWLR